MFKNYITINFYSFWEGMLLVFLFCFPLNVSSFNNEGAGGEAETPDFRIEEIIEDKFDYCNNINTRQSFYALEKEGVIGISSHSDKENSKDNFFTVLLPEHYNPEEYDVVLNYSLFGLESGSHTTKSINGANAYGGQSIKINNSWNETQEYINPRDLNPGLNEIFFTRRKEEVYSYIIKDLSISLSKKRGVNISLSEENLKNYEGKVHLLGYVAQDVRVVEVEGKSIPINNGIFEFLLEQVPLETKELVATYINAEGLRNIEKFPVENKTGYLNFEFDPYKDSDNIAFFRVKHLDNIIFHDIKLVIGNVEDEKDLILKGLEYKDIVPLNREVTNVTSDYKGYKIMGIGDNDASNVKLYMKFDTSKIPVGYGPKDVRTFAYDRNKREWITLEVDSLDYKNNVIISKTNGDTDYVNGVIKVPEMPETASFAPTMITDMEYANPASGVVQISPPRPSQTGATTTSFPLKLPAGRNGMTPSLNVNYNSEGGNGWMGIGWDMQLPAITLDTHWGVPRFDPNNETEIYQLNGDALVFSVEGEYTMPHRYDGDIARGNRTTFYLRKEGGFMEIKRHGTSPKKYYWEVTDKFGNKSFYGGADRVEDNATVRDDNNNITHWALYETRDTYGNYVRYSYTKNFELLRNNLKAQSFYPKSIKYTLYGENTSNYYEVSFSTVSDREDVLLNARTGTLMLTNYTLKDVTINFKNGSTIKPIRNYQFDYAVTAFEKLQLRKVSEYDSSGELFYSNTMEYYNDIGGNTIIDSLNVVKWQGNPESVDSPLRDMAPSALIIPSGSALGTSASSGFSAGLRVGAGLGYNPASVSFTVGGSYNYAQNKEKNQISFIDINGDGLPDKVFKTNSGIKYLPNLGMVDNQGEFGNARYVTGIGQLDETKSRTNGWGWDANAVFIGVGTSQSTTRTNTNNYFTDFNGDGLPDMVDGSRIKFNQTNSWYGSNPPSVGFGTIVTSTQNPIYSGQISEGIIEILEAELETIEELRADHSQFDHVTLWKAPFSGTVNVSGTAILKIKNDCGDNVEEGEDNVFRLTIEKAREGESTEADVLITKILDSMSEPQDFSLNVFVEKEDNLFFRIHNVENGCGGEVKWIPEVNYIDTPVEKMPYLPSEMDENGKALFSYNAQEDFIMNNGGAWFPPNGASVVKLKFNLMNNDFISHQFSDDIQFRIEKIHTIDNGDETTSTEIEETWTRTYKAASGSFYGDDNTITGVNIAATGDLEGYAFRFYAESTSNVQWNQIGWFPEVIYSTPAINDYPPVSYRTYENNLNESKYWVNGNALPSPNIDPNIPHDGDGPFLLVSHDLESQNFDAFDSLDQEAFPLKINWVIKEKVGGTSKKLYGRTLALYRSGAGPFTIYTFLDITNPLLPQPLSPSSYEFTLTKNDVLELNAASSRLYSAFYIENSTFGSSDEANITIALHPQVIDPYTFEPLILKRPFMCQTPTLAGTSYRGWSHLLYNGGLQYHYDEYGEITNPLYPIIFDGPIDMEVFVSGENGNIDTEEIENQIDNPDEHGDLNGNPIRYTFYNQNNYSNSYFNAAIFSNIDTPISYGFNDEDELTVSLGRFGEYNLYDLLVKIDMEGSNNTFIGLKQRSISKGKATTMDVGVPLSENGQLSGSGTVSNATSGVLNQYVDLNGDRYPDIVSKGAIQYTKMTGGLSSKTYDNRANNFISGNSSTDNTIGVNIAGMAPNSTSEDNNKNTRTNMNSGINTGWGNSFESKQWIDINGDGLPDKVRITRNEVRVALNLGYSFTEEITWGSGYVDLVVSKRTSNGIGLSGGISGQKASFAIGFGAGESTAELNASLIDVNGDGLPDFVIRNGDVYYYYFNNGTGFDTTQNFFHGNIIDSDYSLTGNIFGSYTYGLTWPIPPIMGLFFKLTFTATAGYNAGVNEKSITLNDIDGDGFVDIIENGNNNGEIKAHLNRMGKTYKLKTVRNALGSHWSVTYNRTGNTFDLPNSKWVLETISNHDGFIGDNDFDRLETATHINYENPNYNRREREFLGFGTVRSNQVDKYGNIYRYSITDYHNENIYLKGAIKQNSLYDEDDNLLSYNTTLYNIMDPDYPQTNMYASSNNNYLQTGVQVDKLDKSRLFVAPVKIVSTTVENGESLSLEQQFKKYDSNGNLLTYINFGDNYTSAAPSDKFRTELEYYENLQGVDNSTGYVKKLSVIRQNDEKLLREREAEYNNFGSLKKIRTKLNATENNEVNLKYDGYGNLGMSILDNGFETIFTYDEIVHSYPIEISNSFGHLSSSTYDYLFGIPVLVQDINGQQMRTRIDDRGRIVEVTAPNEMPHGWTLRMQYEGEPAVPSIFNGSNFMVNASNGFEAATSGEESNAIHYAVTRHNVLGAQWGQLLTISLVDGLGQPVQLKKTLFANENSEASLGWSISGKEKKDDFDRTIMAYLPTFQSSYPSNPNILSSEDLAYQELEHQSIPPTTMVYDAKDRVVSTTQPGEDPAMTEYYIDQGMFQTTHTVNNHGDFQTMESLTDVKGRLRKTIQNGTLSTHFHYNVLGEKIRVKNHQGYETLYKYDMAGRRLEERHPDRGLSTYKYDRSGNLVERATSNLISGGQQPIVYNYNYNRLEGIEYPQNPENNVQYMYGAPGNSDAMVLNAVGRLYMQRDASGVQGFGYDKLGNMTTNLRGVAVAGKHTYWFKTHWIYDSHNRIKKIIYPDGDELDYNYNAGGSLSRVVSSENEAAIVDNIEYNDLGERTKIEYGNGAQTSYTYDDRRRLSNLSHQFTGFAVTNKYGYDAVSNITSLSTLQPGNSIPASGQLGGPVSHTYKYDEYNRLVSANGRYTGPNDFTTPLLAQEYSLEMEYDLAHNITRKTQTHIQGEVSGFNDPINSPQTMWRTNYHLDYDGYATGQYVVQGPEEEFGYVQPHAPREIIETPDDDGLPFTDPHYKKQLVEYDANGNQTKIEKVIFEGEQAPPYMGTVAPKTITLRRYLWDEEDKLRAADLNPDENTAHPLAVYTYDAGGQRTVRYVPARLDAKSNANNVSSNERDEVMIYPNALITLRPVDGNQYSDIKIITAYSKHYYIGSERVASSLSRVRDLGLFLRRWNDNFPGIRALANAAVTKAGTGLAKTYEQMEQPLSLPSPEIEEAVNDFNPNGEPYDAYWYHSDHLGSSSYISNLSGRVSQHMEYLPFGETLVDEHLNSYNTPFKFNGKELDDETGNYYYGARYYDPKWSIWLSVDPLAEVTLQPYSAFNNNPIFYIDPDGRMAVPPSTHLDEEGNVLAVYDDGDLGVYTHSNGTTKADIDKNHSMSNTSANGNKIGETPYWDEFVSPETGKAMTNTQVQIGKSFDPIISEMSKKADGMGLYQIAQESRPGGDFDIKGPYKNVGGLLNGKYVTSRSAGNYLAGYNANNGVINYTTFQKLAGKLHQQGFSTKEAIKTVLYGDHIGSSPTYGENMYQYRMSIQGWSDKGKTGSNIDMDQFKRTPTNGLKW